MTITPEALGDDHEDASPTAVGHVGLLYRMDRAADRVGVVAYGSARPAGVGAALRVEKLRAFGLQGGPLWLDRSRGLRWFAALEISLAFLEDLGA